MLAPLARFPFFELRLGGEPRLGMKQLYSKQPGEHEGNN